MVETVGKQLPPPQLTPWQPGESGNPKGRPPNTSSITYWYKKLLAEGNNAEEIATKVLEMAKEGKLDHTKEITDRTDGKVIQTTDHTFDGEGLSAVLLKLRGYQPPRLEEGKEIE